MVTTSCKNFGAIPKKYAQMCSTIGLKQLIKHPTRITCHTSTLIDSVITDCEEKVTQRGVVDTFRTLKCYTEENFERKFKKMPSKLN